jgi:peptidyl-prolyl cis-trans isomerase D
MPFAVFRQHQRKLLAVFAILAMIGFVLSDTLPRWMNSGGINDKDMEVAELYGKKIHQSDVARMQQKRRIANQFMGFADRFGGRNYFGGTSQAEMIDAMILDHEADRLGIPSTVDFARHWIDQQSGNAMNAALFETIRAGFTPAISGEQLLIDVASQARLLLARQEFAMPLVTPLDIFRNYRDQTERTSFKVVPYLAESFSNQVGEPTETEVADLFEKYKDVLADPTKPTPGFKIPRKVNAEFLQIDINQIAKRIKSTLPEAEAKAYYEAHKKEYPLDVELPANLFAGAPELTPPRYIAFEFVRDSITDILARDKANEELQETFGKIRDQEIDKFADLYHNKEDEIAEAKKDGLPTDKLVLPTMTDLSSIAKQYGMKYEATGLIDRKEAETYPVIFLARAGSNSNSSADSKSFADIIFGPRNQLFESFEMSDFIGNRYLGRKIDDQPAHVAELKEVRDQVVRAWKLDKARPLAKKAAEEYANKLRSLGGQIKELSVDTRPVLDIESVTKFQPGPEIPSPYPGVIPSSRGPSIASEIRQIPQAGPAILDALFALKPGDVAVETDLSQSTYYVMTLEKRQPVSYQSLMGPNGSLSSYGGETRMEVMRKYYNDGMERLREQAGYKPQNYPGDEKSRNEDQG